MRRFGWLVFAALVGVGLIAPATNARQANQPGTGEGLEPVASIPFAGGTHLAFTSRGGRDYALVARAIGGAGSIDGAIYSVDVTNPESPRIADELDCGLNQAYLDISYDEKTLLVGSDYSDMEGKECLGQMGFLTIDISDPTRLRAVGFAPIARGSHGATAHPTRPYVYNSYGDVVATDAPEFEIWSIANPAKPKLVKKVFTPGYHGPHDMTFSPDGRLMVASNVSTIQVFDTSDPAEPVLLSTLQCPGCVHTHESRFTPDGKKLVVTDESMAGPNPCPGGGLYFYDVAKDGELTLTGGYQPDAAVAPEGRSTPTFCTAHVIGLSRDGTKVAASWHGAGLRYIDITNTDGFTFGSQHSTGGGARELGWWAAPDSDTMSAKLYKGPYLYSNDANRGFEVFKIVRGD